MTKTVTFKTAKLLKEAGWKQELAHGSWYYYIGRKGLWLVDSIQRLGTMTPEQYLAAPDVSELLEELPKKVSTPWEAAWRADLTLEADDEVWKVGYVYIASEEGDTDLLYSYTADTPAEALALLWLELKKQNLL